MYFTNLGHRSVLEWIDRANVIYISVITIKASKKKSMLTSLTILENSLMKNNESMTSCAKAVHSCACTRCKPKANLTYLVNTDSPLL